MKITSPILRAASVALLHGSAVYAQATTTTDSETSATTTSAEPSCTASLITTLCDYKSPGPEFAVASSGEAHCWDYCNNNQPCDFVIFLAGNPYLGTGTCWLFPGEDYDPSAGTTEGCRNQAFSVFDKPVCDVGPDGTPTVTDACAATASPSAIASVCGYPTPPDGCWDSCYASGSAAHCLSLCAEADSCSYVVFNQDNPSNTPHSDGTCWVFPDGEYGADAAGSCDGEPPEQYVYTNVCPKPRSSSTFSSSGSSPTDSGNGSSKGSENNGDDKNDDANGENDDEKGDGDGGSAASMSVPPSLAALLIACLGLIL